MLPLHEAQIGEGNLWILFGKCPLFWFIYLNLDIVSQACQDKERSEVESFSCCSILVSFQDGHVLLDSATTCTSL
jgi:hypothetical protein